MVAMNLPGYCPSQHAERPDHALRLMGIEAVLAAGEDRAGPPESVPDYYTRLAKMEAVAEADRRG
jgi:hypothetical protein